jgi:hypothetical protein
MRAKSTIAALAAAMSWLVPLEAARAQPTCEDLGAATQFGTIARRQLSTRELVSYGTWSMGSWLVESACTLRANLQGTYVRDEDFQTGGAHIVATSPKGTAVRFDRHRTPEDHQVPNSLDGTVITGGGRVTGIPDLNQDDQPPPIDSSGTRPEVDTCEAAFVDAVAASDAFAALPPDLVFGNVVATMDEGNTYLDLRGASTVQIDSLFIQPGKLLRYQYSLPHLCEEDGGDLTFEVDPGTVTVVNVDRLDIGNCGGLWVDPYTSTVILNVVGRGRKVRIGIESDSYEGIHLLAPQRRVDIVGAGSDIGTYFGPVIADRLKVLGYAEQVGDVANCVADDDD